MVLHQSIGTISGELSRKKKNVVKICKKKQFDLCELLFLCYTIQDNEKWGKIVTFLSP